MNAEVPAGNDIALAQLLGAIGEGQRNMKESLDNMNKSVTSLGEKFDNKVAELDKRVGSLETTVETHSRLEARKLTTKDVLSAIVAVLAIIAGSVALIYWISQSGPIS